MANHINFFSTNLTSNTLAGATTTPLNSIPTCDAPFYLTLDATGINSHQEVIYVTSKTATNVNHAATTYAHTTAEEVRMDVVADELDALYSANETTGMFRQSLINGNFDIWQRGTSIAMTAANAYTADRWYCETATAGTDKTVSRQDGTGINGSYYCARVAMVQDQDELLTFSQALESQDSIKFRGKKVTLSFYARGGAEFVSDNPVLVSKIVTGKGTDQKVLAFTTSADAVSQNNTLTTGWQKFTCTTSAVIASDITQIGISFSFTHAGSGVTTNYFEIAQVQLCEGDVALPFQPKSFEEELRACQRYYEKSYNYAVAPGTNAGGNGLFERAAITTGVISSQGTYKVSKRPGTITVTIYASDGTADAVTAYGGANVTGVAVDSSAETGFREITKTGGFTAGVYYQFQFTASAEL